MIQHIKDLNLNGCISSSQSLIWEGVEMSAGLNAEHDDDSLAQLSQDVGDMSLSPGRFQRHAKRQKVVLNSTSSPTGASSGAGQSAEGAGPLFPPLQPSLLTVPQVSLQQPFGQLVESSMIHSAQASFHRWKAQLLLSITEPMEFGFVPDQ